MIDSVYRKSTNGTIFILNLRHIISRPPGNGAVIRSFSSSRIGSGRVATLTFTKLAKRRFDSCKDFFNIANKFLKKLYQNVARKTRVPAFHWTFVKRLAYFTHYMYNIFLRNFMTYLALNVYTFVCSFQKNREVEKRKNVFHASKKHAKHHQ